MTKEELLKYLNKNEIYSTDGALENLFPYKLKIEVYNSEILEILDTLYGEQLFHWMSINKINATNIANPDAIWDYTGTFIYFKNEDDMLFIKLKYA